MTPTLRWIDKRRLLTLAAPVLLVASCRGTGGDPPASVGIGFGAERHPGTTEELDRESQVVVEKAVEEADLATEQQESRAADATGESDGAKDDGGDTEDPQR